MARYWNPLIGILSCGLLAGCAFSSSINSDALSYNDVIEDTNDTLLVTNILRARDKAPLYFADIPLIHESLQATATLSANVPFGPLLKSTSRESVTPMIGIQTTPSFDIDTLDTKDFITGISSPIDTNLVKYWLDRGLDQRIVLLAFFPSAEIVETIGSGQSSRKVSIIVKNAPRESIDGPEKVQPSKGINLNCLGQSQFERYLTLIDAIKVFFANSYTERTLLAKGIKLNSSYDIRNISTLDTTKFKLICDAKNQCDLYSTATEQKTALCYSKSAAGNPPGGSIGLVATKDNPEPQTNNANPCTQSVVTKSPETSSTPSIARVYPTQITEYCKIFDTFLDHLKVDQDASTPPPTELQPKFELSLATRSVGEMIAFLGDLVYYQEHQQRDANHNIPVTLGWCDKSGDCGNGRTDDGGVLFRLDPDPANARFGMRYRDRSYYVSNSSPQDHTLQVLAVLNQLINLNKSASEIKSTPFVQVLP